MAETVIITEKNIEEHTSHLREDEAVVQVGVIVDDFVQSGSIGDAYLFLRKLEKSLSGQALNPKTKNIYRDYILSLKFTTFPMLESQEQRELLRQYLTFALRNQEEKGLGLDMQNRAHFVFYPYFRGKEDREKLNVLVKAIESNEEVIGQEPLTTENGEEVKSTIANWISNYKLVTRSQESGALALATYTSENSNFKKLPSDKQELLKKVLSFYNWLRYKALPQDILQIDRSITDIEKSGQPDVIPDLTSKEPQVLQPPVSPPLEPPEIKPKEKPDEEPQKKQIPPAPPPKRTEEPPESRRPPASTRFGEAGETVDRSQERPEPPSTEQRGPIRAAPPKSDKPKVDEQLYRSTLEELRKMREEYEGKGKVKGQSGQYSQKSEVERNQKPRPKTKPAAAPDNQQPISKPAATPKTQPPITDKSADLSVNEAVARAGRDYADHGEIITREEKQDIDRKLEELRKRIEESDS